MRIVYHLGAHCTDEEKILKCLLKNRGALADEGIIVPGPARYRSLLRETAAELKGQSASRDTEAMVLDAIMDEDHAERLILSFDSFMAFPNWVIGRNMLYPAAADRTSGLAKVFPDLQCEFFLAIRNPATFLPSLFERLKNRTYDDFTNGVDPMTLKWSDVVTRIRAANPGVPITVWCDEDTPLIWTEVLRELSGHDPATVLEGVDDLLSTIMSKDGLSRMQAYLQTHPPQSEIQRRRIVAAFLDKFALADEIEIELDFPGWTEDFVDAMTAQYEDDMTEIARMPGVTFIAP